MSNFHEKGKNCFLEKKSVNGAGMVLNKLRFKRQVSFFEVTEFWNGYFQEETKKQNKFFRDNFFHKFE